MDDHTDSLAPAAASNWKAVQGATVPWSKQPTAEETMYRQRRFARTAGTRFALPPPKEALIEVFSELVPKSRLSVGAKALCKHHARAPNHSFWRQPLGPEAVKTAMALRHLHEMFEQATWHNVHQLSPSLLVYEMRNPEGYGMRWTLEPVLAFRGYLEPVGPHTGT
ncbi:hypothetical protein WJX72_006135 [[Myrmecia] bisecta]|uniref:Uncharacterized protein n=1 Tax=[Myrmecia] bisecta TaxID=41462 RepID=A0AAW1P9T3_9CHLO